MSKFADYYTYSPLAAMRTGRQPPCPISRRHETLPSPPMPCQQEAGDAAQSPMPCQQEAGDAAQPPGKA